jgi:ribulose-5-phosphate 4-epimerase/fuculose-1-phosphate aldolase
MLGFSNHNVRTFNFNRLIMSIAELLRNPPLALKLASKGEFAISHISPLKGQVSDAEWRTRCDLAAAYRLVAQHGWDDMLSTHLSARVPGEDAYLINPYGILFSQVTASCLIKISLDGKALSDSPFPINPAAVNFHGSVMRARPDVQSAMHMHSTAGVAVSTQKDGLLPLNQRALYFMPILAYHDYAGLGVEDSEGDALARDLGSKWALIMRNHGTLTVGRSVAQAFVYTYFLERACQYQLATQVSGVPLIPLSDDVVAVVPKQAGHFEYAGLMEWPALLATLDGSHAQ